MWAGFTTLRRHHLSEMLLLGHDAQIIIVQSRDHSAFQSRPFAACSRLELAITICCIMAMNRCWSALPRSATVGALHALTFASVGTSAFFVVIASAFNLTLPEFSGWHDTC
jgi:hypothetical protein